MTSLQRAYNFGNDTPTKRSFMAFRYERLIVMALLAILFIGCADTRSPIQGTYRIYSDDPAVKFFNNGQDIYINIQDNGTIVYNTTINYKPKFHNEGTYTFDEKTSTLNIKWKSGKMPNKLTVQKQNEEYMIQIGETVYKKDKSSS